MVYWRVDTRQTKENMITESIKRNGNNGSTSQIASAKALRYNQVKGETEEV